MRCKWIVFVLILTFSACSKEEGAKETTSENEPVLVGDNSNSIVHHINQRVQREEDEQNSVEVDVDNDYETDFVFKASSYVYGCPEFEETENVKINCSSGETLTVTFENSGSYEVAYDEKGSYPLALSRDDVLNEELNWVKKEDYNTLLSIDNEKGGGVSSIEGEWLNTAYGYLGLRKIENGKTVYGWLEINIEYNEVIVVKSSFVK